jgi:hypothetical protein
VDAFQVSDETGDDLSPGVFAGQRHRLRVERLVTMAVVTFSAIRGERRSDHLLDSRWTERLAARSGSDTALSRSLTPG